MSELLDFLDLVVLERRQHEILADHATVGVRVGADAQLALRHEGQDVVLDGAVGVEQLFRLVGLQPVLEDLEVGLGVAGGSSGTWWARQEPSVFLPSMYFGQVQPFGVRKMIIG